MNRLEWLDTATRKIIFRPDRKAVRKELAAHFEDLREARGLDEEAAAAAMGDPVKLAEELGRLHRPWWGWLWRVSRIALLLAVVLWFLCAREYGFGEFKRWMYNMPQLPKETTDSYLTVGAGTVSVLETWRPVGTKDLGHYRLSVPRAWLEQGVDAGIDEDGRSFQRPVCRLKICLRADTWKFWAVAPRKGEMIPAALDSEGRRYDLGYCNWRTDAGETCCSSWQGPFTTWYHVALELPGPEDAPEWVELSVGYGGGTVRVSLESEVMS